MKTDITSENTNTSVEITVYYTFIAGVHWPIGWSKWHQSGSHPTCSHWLVLLLPLALLYGSLLAMELHWLTWMIFLFGFSGFSLSLILWLGCSMKWMASKQGRPVAVPVLVLYLTMGVMGSAWASLFLLLLSYVSAVTTCGHYLQWPQVAGLFMFQHLNIFTLDHISWDLAIWWQMDRFLFLFCTVQWAFGEMIIGNHILSNHTILLLVNCLI